ncbi:MAG: hypothetical protein ACYC3X_01350 [Pirellulaceae bacterium]
MVLAGYFGSDLLTAGIAATELGDWHQVIDWWFDKYGTYAVAVKSQDAYRRDIDYAPTPAEKVEDAFRKKVQGQSVNADLSPRRKGTSSSHRTVAVSSRRRSQRCSIDATCSKFPWREPPGR